MNTTFGRFAALALVMLACSWSSAASAGLTNAQKCERAKNKAAGKRASCIATQRRKEIAGKAPDYASCSAKMSAAFATAETNAAGMCPTTGDAAAVEDRIDGTFSPSQGLPRALSGARFVDNGDGTVTDTQTGLMWEKKNLLDNSTNFSNPHDADNYYTWSDTGPAYEAPSGTLFTDFLYKLNNCTYDGVTFTGGFAGHCDWRLPTLQELQTIVDLTVANCGSGSECIPAAFGPTSTLEYWSYTAHAGGTATAWQVDFDDGGSVYSSKDATKSVRAVRGGL